MIPSFREAANAMRTQGIFYSQALIDRLAHRVGETNGTLP
jgi:hypothetical protein